MKRRSTISGCVFGCGFIGMLLLGATGTKLMRSTPVVMLPPELEKHYQSRGFKAWLKFNEHRIEVQPPKTLALSRIERRKLGAFALEKYVALAKGQTVIDVCSVIPPEGATWGREDVTSLQLNAAQMVSGFGPMLQQTVARTTTATATFMVAPALQGAGVLVDLSTSDAESGRRVAQALLQLPQVTFVHVAPVGTTIDVGRDAVAMLASGSLVER